MTSTTPENSVPETDDTVLLDTDVYSYLRRNDRRADLYRRHVQGKRLAVSFVTVGELLLGAVKNKWDSAKISSLKQGLRTFLVVPYDYEVCVTYANLKTTIQSKGLAVADNDLWIAACAVRHSIPLVSNNRKHFEKIPGLVLISEQPVEAKLEAQGKIAFVETSASASNESQQPSSQSASVSEKKET